MGSARKQRKLYPLPWGVVFDSRALNSFALARFRNAVSGLFIICRLHAYHPEPTHYHTNAESFFHDSQPSNLKAITRPKLWAVPNPTRRLFQVYRKNFEKTELTQTNPVFTPSRCEPNQTIETRVVI